MIKFNPFFVALAVYVTLIYFIVTTEVTHPLLVGLLVGYLLVDRIISQVIITMLLRAAVKYVQDHMGGNQV